MTRTFCDQCDCLLEEGKQRVKLEQFSIGGADKRGKGFTLAASGIFCSTSCLFTQMQGLVSAKAPNFDEHCQKPVAAPTQDRDGLQEALQQRFGPCVPHPQQPFVLPTMPPQETFYCEGTGSPPPSAMTAGSPLRAAILGQ